MKIQSLPTVALLPWGNCIEDFLDTIGVSFESFCNEMTGGWMFGYVEALQQVGIRTVLFCISARVNATERCLHQPTGTTICVLPAPGMYRAVRQQMSNPYGWTVKDVFGDVRGLHQLWYAGLKTIAPYLATPLVRLAQAVRREGCQVILCQEYEYARFDACVLLGRLLGLPVFATFQGGDFQLSRLEGYLRPLTLRACTGLVIPTQTEAQRVQAQYGVASSKIAQIFNPLEVGDYRAVDRREARAKLHIPPTAQVVVYHGRIDIHRKGLDILLEAWQHVCRDRPGRELRLLLVGTGSDASKLRDRIVAMQLQGITWIDQYIHDRDLLRTYLAAADVYALPSRHEGFPVAPLEAMACGLPVVAADAPGIPDILEGEEASGGLVVPREDPVALALALGRVLDDEGWRCELGRRARLRVKASFSLEAVGRQLGNFLALAHQEAKS